MISTFRNRDRATFFCFNLQSRTFGVDSAACTAMNLKKKQILRIVSLKTG